MRDLGIWIEEREAPVGDILVRRVRGTPAFGTMVGYRIDDPTVGWSFKPGTRPPAGAVPLVRLDDAEAAIAAAIAGAEPRLSAIAQDLGDRVANLEVELEVERERSASARQLLGTATSLLESVWGDALLLKGAVTPTRGVCGGCRGLGAHSPRCWTQPGSRWKRLADKAESLGDEIGANDPDAANLAYALAGRLSAHCRDEGGNG